MGFLIPAIGMGGGPLYVNSVGLPARWDNSIPLPLHPEVGSCASFSNTAVVQKMTENVAYWGNIENIDLGFTIVENEINVDVTGSNYETYLSFDSESNAVIFDDDGTIINALYGTEAEYYLLGFAGFNTPGGEDNIITSGVAVFNCYCIENNDCPEPFSVEDFDSTVVHEMGHFIGLDHTQVNEALVEAPCNTSVQGDCDTVPIMYPTAYDAFEPIALQRDDEVAALMLYGEAGWSSGHCIVTGSLNDADGNPLRCADVQAITDDTADTVSFVSGALAEATDNNGDDDTTDSGECTSGCGDFVLYGLNPSKEYTLWVKPINSLWIGASSVGPCENEQNSGIVEEQIGTISGCTAGETTDMGSVQTTSTGAQDSGDDAEGDSESDVGSGSSDSCGDGGNFDHCDELISCGLNPQKGRPLFPVGLVFLLGPVGVVFLFRMKMSLVRRSLKDIF